MKKFIITALICFISCLATYAESESYNAVSQEDKIIYNQEQQSWSFYDETISGIVFVKKHFSGAGSYSQYHYEDGAWAFTLTSDFEFIKDGVLVAVDNANLKYNKVVFNGENFEEVSLSYFELQKMFPDAELLRLSFWNGDNKIWVTKPFSKKKQLLVVNDTDKYYYNLTAKSKNVQDSNMRGLITLSRFGIYNFIHYGERNGKLIMYVR